MSSLKTATKVIEAIQSNPQIAEIAKDFITGTLTTPQPPKVPEVSQISFPGIEILITIILLTWSISIIYSTFIIKDKETKENLKYTHYVLFGGIGIIPMLIIIWVLTYIVYISFPSFIQSFPKVDQLISKALNKFV